MFRKSNLQCFLSADSRIIDFKPYFPLKILDTLKKLIIKRDLPIGRLAPFSLSNICLLFLEVKAVIDEQLNKIFFTHHCPHTFQR